jgi:predicted NBD/HSP70 family sugar kinase
MARAERFGRRDARLGASGAGLAPHQLQKRREIGVRAARVGDEFAVSLVRAAGRVHGWVAHQLDQLFDPEKIVFAGLLVDLGHLFLAAVRETARQLGNAGHEPAIAGSTLGRYNGAVGAAALALHHWKPRR